MAIDEDDFSHDSDPDEDYSYNGSDQDDDNEDYSYNGSDQDDDNYNDGDDPDPDLDDHVCPQMAYTVLNESDIRQRQDDEMSHVSSILSVPEPDASLLLCHYKWNVSRLHEQWFADEAKVRAMVGLMSSNRPPAAGSDVKELICGICFDSLPQDQIFPTVCGHPYCVTCWKGYITSTVNDGPGCLSFRCPEPSCRSAVGRDMIDALASDDEKLKYFQYFLRTYVEGKKMIKWCPGPGCENAVELEPDSSVFDVTCQCSYAFCWNCTEDAHRPLDCGTVAKWVFKNNSEAENTEWILANSKPCPECKRPIEKNNGCMHMTCTPPCKFEFCWLCLGPWVNHGSETGGNYACNRYETNKEKGLHCEEEKRRDMAKKSIERYTHYYERWASNRHSRKKATQDLHTAQTADLQKLSNMVKIPESQLKFIIEAWEQIIECRRVLKWSYAYTYYLPEHEDTKRQFFEYLQGLAENALERLHLCTEKELSDDFLSSDDDEPQKDFMEFQVKLVDLTKVTHSFFENLVRAVENGLSEVDSPAVGNTEDGMNKGST